MFEYRNISIVLATCIIASMITFPGCEEMLPPRNDPSKLFRGSIDARYSLLWNENALHIGVNIVNIYDETIQTTAAMMGTVEISLVGNTVHRKTITLNTNNLINTKAYNPSTKELTIDPGESIRFEYVWNFVDDNNQNLPADIFRYYPDPNCLLRRLAYREAFTIAGSFQIIQKFGLFELNPIVINLCYISAYVSAHDCSAPPTDCLQR
jgi:hypothetical protein